jgi:prepilin-type N-terminal cleavage/methylation domain-containing protein
LKIEMIRKNTARGFTLIELLVVIAIIGILSSVVLASLNSARSKGNDAKIQSQLAGFRAAAEIWYSNSGNTYAGLCTASADPAVGPYLLAANYPGGTAPTCQNAAANTYLMFHALSSDATKAWCVDASGSSKQETTSALTAGVTVCP